MTRCVVVVDETLAPGLAANAAAVLATSLGARLPDLVGEDFTDGAGEPHAGLIKTGLPVLRAPAAELRGLRARAVEAECGVIGMPAFGHATNDYDEFRALVGQTETPDYLGLVLFGPQKLVRRLTGSLGLLR
jgi:hypothetical protein